MAINKKQFRIVLLAEVAVLAAIALTATLAWEAICDDTWRSCVADQGESGWLSYLLLSLMRPFLFTPILVLSMISGELFGDTFGAAMSALGATLSVVPVYIAGDYLGRKLVRPWLRCNLPSSWKLIQTHDYKIVFISRWIPLIPFDLMSLFAGIMKFRLSYVMAFSFLGLLPQAYVFAKFASTPSTSVIGMTLVSLSLFGALTSIPLLIYEYLSRRKGSSLWTQIKRAYFEIVYEARVNNTVDHTEDYGPDRPTVVLLYGFFSSRRATLIMERLLRQRGFSVMSFNQGGLFGVFFTRGIRETAAYIGAKIKGKMRDHKIEKVHVVAHSKGGLVGLFWLLRLGGYRYCDKIITLGTPFNGTNLSWLGLATPVGFFWRDIWQMRKGSRLLEQIRTSPCPENLIIYCCYSKKDKVANGANGILVLEKGMNHVVPVPMHHISHFEYLYRRDVGDCVARILKRPNYELASGDGLGARLPADEGTGEGGEPKGDEGKASNVIDIEDHVLKPPKRKPHT